MRHAIIFDCTPSSLTLSLKDKSRKRGKRDSSGLEFLQERSNKFQDRNHESENQISQVPVSGRAIPLALYPVHSEFSSFQAQKYGHLLKRCILKRLCIRIETKRIQYE